MKYLAFLLLLTVLAAPSYSTGITRPISCPYVFPPSCTWINNPKGYATFPLCWPNGYPYATVPACGCYSYDTRAWQDPSRPCLPPIINGYLVPPCTGKYVQIFDAQSYNYY